MAGPRITAPVFGLNSEPWHGQAMMFAPTPGRRPCSRRGGRWRRRPRDWPAVCWITRDGSPVVGSVNAAEPPDRHLRGGADGRALGQRPRWSWWWTRRRRWRSATAAVEDVVGGTVVGVVSAAFRSCRGRAPARARPPRRPARRCRRPRCRSPHRGRPRPRGGPSADAPGCGRGGRPARCRAPAPRPRRPGRTGSRRRGRRCRSR